MHRPTRSTAIFHSVLLLIGATSLLLGSLLARASIAPADVDAGTLLGTQFIGQTFGAMLITRRPEVSLKIGLCLAIAAGFALSSRAVLLRPLLVLLGIGVGMALSSATVAAGEETAVARRTSALEILNVFWSIGAALSVPAAIYWGRFSNPWGLYAVLASLFLLCLSWLVIAKPAVVHASSASFRATNVLGPRRLAVLAIAACLAVGAETGMAVWLPRFATRVGLSATMLVAVAAGFWCGSLISRLTFAWLLRRVARRHLCAAAAVLSVVFFLLVPALTRPLLLLLVATIAAMSIAPLYPALLADSVEVKGKGFVFVAAGLGSAFAPWAIGKTSTVSGSLRFAMLVPGLCAIALLVSLWKAGMFAGRSPTEVPLPD